MQLTTGSLHHDNINQRNVPIRRLRETGVLAYNSFAIMFPKSTPFENVSLIPFVVMYNNLSRKSHHLQLLF